MKDGTIQRVEWRCASRDSGGECAVIPGIPVMQWLSVDSLVLPQNVRDILNVSILLLASFPGADKAILLLDQNHACIYI